MDILSQFGIDGVGAKYRRQDGRATDHGYPIAGDGPIPLLTPEERERIRYGLNVYARVFDLSKPEELAAYTEVRDKIANRRYIQLDRTKLTQPDGSLKIHLEWADPQGILNLPQRRP